MRILFVILCLTGVSLYAGDAPQSPDSTHSFSTIDSKEEDTFRRDTKRFAEFEKEQTRRRKIAYALNYSMRYKNTAEGAIWLLHQDISVEELAAAVFDNSKKARRQTDQSSAA